MNTIPINKIQIQTISTCNANCVFCPYVESWHKDNPGRMERSLYEKILKELEDAPNLTTFCPYLENEPMSDKRIVNWIEDFYDKFPDKTVELSVNPLMLNEKNRNDLLKVFKDRKHILPISFHGMNQLTFEHIMSLPFKQCYENTIELLKLSEGRLNITLNGAGMSRDGKILYFTNGHYYQFWMDTLRSNNIDPKTVNIRPFTFHDRAGQITREERGANKNNYGVVRKIGPDHKFWCNRFDETLHVLWNGDVIICCMDYKKDVPNLGNLSKITMLEYYNSKPYEELIMKASGKVPCPEGFLCTRCISPGG